MEDEMGRICSTKVENRNAYRKMWENQKETSLGRPRRRWVDNVKTDGLLWTGLIWLRIGTNGGLL
jgi:hypothetical protein